jgi:hypothetical protein
MVALAGFFIGGVYSFWRNGHRGLSVVLGVFALLALGAAVLWSGA